MASGKGKWGKRAFSFGFRSRARRLGDFLRKGIQDALDETQKEAEKAAEDAVKAAADAMQLLQQLSCKLPQTPRQKRHHQFITKLEYLKTTALLLYLELL